MPHRWLCLLIVAFWLATTGWLFWTEVLPDWTPGQPPPFTIDLLDDVEVGRPRIDWTALFNGQASHRAETWVRRRRRAPDWMHRPLPDDAFEVGVSLVQRTGPDAPQPVGLLPKSFESLHLVTRQGDLLATHSELTIEVVGLPVVAECFGEVRDGQFLAHARIPNLYDQELPPTPAPRHGSFLNPLHPLMRIKGLRLGQEWDMPLVDPMADALAASSPLGAPERDSRVHARVLPTQQTLRWKGKPMVCLVIEYTGKHTEARTWVHADGGQVLRQESLLRDAPIRGPDGASQPQTLVLERLTELDEL